MEQQLELHLCEHVASARRLPFLRPIATFRLTDNLLRVPGVSLFQGHNARKMHGQVAHGERLQVRDLLLGKWGTCYEYS